ncbi:MAG TPA: SPW repeat protein [Candidatus Dormibacteraeota bacterium]
MTAWRRWQDYATMIAGILLFVSPFVFGETSQGVAALGAYVLGVLLLVAGILAAAMPARRGIEIVPAVLGVVTFASPWVLGFAGITTIAWTAWVLGIVVVLAAGSLLLGRGARLTTA